MILFFWVSIAFIGLYYKHRIIFDIDIDSMVNAASNKSVMNGLLDFLQFFSQNGHGLLDNNCWRQLTNRLHLENVSVFLFAYINGNIPMRRKFLRWIMSSDSAVFLHSPQ